MYKVWVPSPGPHNPVLGDGSSHLSLIPVPGDLTPSNPSEHHTAHRNTCVIFKISQFFKKNKTGCGELGSR